MNNINNNKAQNNLVSKAVDQYELWRKNNIFKIRIGENGEVAIVSGRAYHNSIPTKIFNYCLMKEIMITIGTTLKEL